MAEKTSYYYIRLKHDFFESEDMKLLQSLKDGYLYSDIYLKLCLKSLDQNGRLMYRGRIPYSPEMISVITGHSVGVVEKAVKTLVELGFVELLDNGAIYMLDIQNFIGKSSTEADRKREYRRAIDEEKNSLTEKDNDTQTLTDGQMSGQMSEDSEDICRTNLSHIYSYTINSKDINSKNNNIINNTKDNTISNNKQRVKENNIEKHGYGDYGWVKLTDAQHEKLANDLGVDELKRCIQYIDESAQSTGNKNKWKDWNLIIRRCSREGWGKSKFGTVNRVEQRINEVDKW